MVTNLDRRVGDSISWFQITLKVDTDIIKVRSLQFDKSDILFCHNWTAELVRNLSSTILKNTYDDIKLRSRDFEITL